MPRDHPEGELASYLDGSATGEERRVVDAHLVECASCRADLEFAARGRAAMQALPQLESPGLVGPELDLHRDGQEAPTSLRSAVRNRPRRRTGGRPSQVPVWPRWAWGAGIAAAASLAALFVFSSLNGGSKQATSLAGGSAEQRAESAFRSSTDYDRASLDALAGSLAQRTRAAVKSGTSADSGKTLLASPAPPQLFAPVASGPASAPSARALDQAPATQALDCLRRGAGLPADATASYLEAASFGGTPAFIGAFPNGPPGGSPTQLQVIAVDRASCQVLYVVTLPL